LVNEKDVHSVRPNIAKLWTLTQRAHMQSLSDFNAVAKRVSRW